MSVFDQHTWDFRHLRDAGNPDPLLNSSGFPPVKLHSKSGECAFRTGRDLEGPPSLGVQGTLGQKLVELTRNLVKRIKREDTRFPT